MMRSRSWLIVNADELGAGPGVDSGIFEAHRCGTVTSASLLVGTRWSREAAMAARSMPTLSIGLHVDVDDALQRDPMLRPKLVRDALRGQLAAFERLIGRAPTHLDSYHDAHEEPIANAEFLRFARSHRLTLRGLSSIRSVRLPRGTGTDALLEILKREIRDGITELVCHPGHLDSGREGSLERVFELKALCSPRLRATLAERSIKPIRHEDVSRLFARAAGF